MANLLHTQTTSNKLKLTMKNMLGNNEVLRRMWSGPLLTFLERLNGESGEEWETAFDRFLRKEEIAWDGKFQIEIDLDHRQ